ncbi:MAG: hypothetical protein WA949_07825 [Phormidesmis sp.]
MAKLLLVTGLGCAVLFAFHALSVLMFAVLGLVPSSPNWSKGLILAGVLAIASTTVCLQSLTTQQSLYRLLGTISSIASGAILGVFVSGRISEQQLSWVVVGLTIGGLLFGAVAFWSYGVRKSESRRLVGGAIALINGLCAYTLAFGLGTWFFAALTVNSWILSGILGIATSLSLLATRRSLTVFVRWVALKGS